MRHGMLRNALDMSTSSSMHQARSWSKAMAFRNMEAMLVML